MRSASSARALLLGGLGGDAPRGLRAAARPPRGRRAGRLHHRPARLLDDRARGRPGRAHPAARQRDSDRGGGRAFRPGGLRTTHSRPRHRLGRPPARRARSMAGGARGVGVDRSEAALAVAAGQCGPPRNGRPRAISAVGDWAEGLGSDVRPDPVQPALCRDRRRSAARRRRTGSRTRRCSRRPTASANIAVSRP